MKGIQLYCRPIGGVILLSEATFKIAAVAQGGLMASSAFPTARCSVIRCMLDRKILKNLCSSIARGPPSQQEQLRDFRIYFTLSRTAVHKGHLHGF